MSEFFKKLNVHKYLRCFFSIPAFLIIFWVLFTLTNQNLYNFNTDETWAYNIAADLNFIEIIKLMHYEGHAFLWYIILKPFTYFSSWFPYIIKYINWFFCFCAMILLCFFAPIKNYIKALITLTSPFLVIYPNLGRPYGLMIFLLFLLTMLYKDRLKKPFLYSILIFITTNSDINAAFVTFILSCFLIYDLYNKYKNWKNKHFLYPTLIMILGFLALLIQWFPFSTPNHFIYDNKIRLFYEFFFQDAPNALIILTFIIFVPLFYTAIRIFFNDIKEFRWKIFAIYIVSIMTFFYLFIAPGFFYHYYFYYIYLIILYWLLLENSQNFKSNKRLYITCSAFLISVSIIFNFALRPTNFWFFFQRLNEKAIKQIEIFVPKNSTIYMNIEFTQTLMPFLKKNYKLKTCQEITIPSYQAYKNIYLIKFLAPFDINIDKNENSYYLSSRMNYIHKIKNLDIYCVTLNSGFVLCKLPYNNDFLSKNLSEEQDFNVDKLKKVTLHQLKMIVPENSTIYMESTLENRFASDLKNVYNIKNIKNLPKFEKTQQTSNSYIFFLYDMHSHDLEIPENCVIVNKYYALCKY